MDAKNFQMEAALLKFPLDEVQGIAAARCAAPPLLGVTGFLIGVTIGNPDAEKCSLQTAGRKPWSIGSVWYGRDTAPKPQLLPPR